MNEGARERAGMEAILRQAIRNDTLELQYQPRIQLSSGHATGVEALVRLRHGGELISPTRFIRIAEETGLIGLVGALGVDIRLPAASPPGRTRPLAHLKVSINVSPMQARREEFYDIARGDHRAIWHLPVAHRARNHREHAGGAEAAHHRESGKAAESGLHGGARRFRHGLFEPVLPQPSAGRHAEDRPLIRERQRFAGGLRRGGGDRGARKGARERHCGRRRRDAASSSTG